MTYQGKVTATYKEYSDRLLELLLKAHRPDKFKDRVASEHSLGDPLESLLRSLSCNFIRPVEEPGGGNA